MKWWVFQGTTQAVFQYTLYINSMDTLEHWGSKSQVQAREDREFKICVTFLCACDGDVSEWIFMSTDIVAEWMYCMGCEKLYVCSMVKILLSA